MRMDAFGMLDYESKVNAIEQFARVYDVDELMKCTHADNLFYTMRDFECGIDSNGNLCPADDLSTLGDLLEAMTRVKYSQSDVEAWAVAMDEVHRYVEGWEEPPQTFDEMQRVMRLHGIMFDDDGHMVFVG